MQDFVNFVHGQPCAFLANGSYRDVQVLLQFALKCDTEDLIRRCLSAMTLKVDCENATDHSRVIQKFSEYLYKEDFEFFRNFFKELSEFLYYIIIYICNKVNGHDVLLIYFLII